MEDGSDGIGSLAVLSPPLNGDAVDVMANFPNIENTVSSPLKVNGESNLVESAPENDDKDSSDCDALVIDESAINQPKKKKIKLCNPAEEFVHTNPYFSESIFELSTQYKKEEKPTLKSIKQLKLKKTFRGKNGKPKEFREYAQYLGLQPTVQFKCSRCGSSGFPTLQSLNDHVAQCTAKAAISPPVPQSNNTTNLRITRKVFLCSACGTYYENWNLFLHMREVHKRFICLYCLGMFPHAEKLSLHLISKHHCAPAHFDTVSDFFGAYKDPCFLMCCDCQSVFNEQEDFSNHGCVSQSTTEKPALTYPSAENLLVEPVKSEISDSSDNKINLNNSEQTKDTVVEKASVNEIGDNQVIENTQNLDEVQMSSKGDMIVNESHENNVDSNSKLENNYNSRENSSSREEINMVEDESSSYVHYNNEEEQDDEDRSQQQADIQSDNSDNNDEDNEDLNENMDEGSEDGRDCNKMDESMELDVEEDNENDCMEETIEDIRKVPKVTLNLTKLKSYNPDDEDEDDEEEYQSDDSEKLTLEVEKDSDQEIDATTNDILEEDTKVELEDEDSKTVIEEEEESKNETSIVSVATAGPDIHIIELELEQPLDKFDIKLLLQKCLGATIGTCLYCNHARKIAVNGKQLGLHAIAEHRYSAIVKSITAEELIPESFNSRITECFSELENIYFNLESASAEGGVTFSHIFECFQCRYSTTVHKELYLHNRKLHTKAILLCIMCKTSFYSYSELVCHLCPGIYVLQREVQFRCCLCVSDDLPSSFRLMVHLRKKHHVCDVCLEMCHNQSRLSNHVWKHKLHHLCYRCGIAYRNKPDITKHLYWKHGTESVLCKKCMQKKWPHVYHFCIPPTSFVCEECNLSFSKAVSLMVHKRLHREEYPHSCSNEGCTEKFISKKLLLKHEFKHRQPIEEPKKEEVPEVKQEIISELKVENVECDVETKPKVDEIECEEKVIEKPKPKVDVFDLPELNLSESDSSESEDEKEIPTETSIKVETDNILEPSEVDNTKTEGDSETKDNLIEENPVPILENVWDDFKNYQANIAKLDILTDVGKDENEYEEPSILTDIPLPPSMEEALRDHDYCAPTMDTLKEEDGLPNNQDRSADHDYCSANEQKENEQKKGILNNKKIKNNLSSDSSSDSDSSSCTCGSNCSCTSNSSSSSTSDSSESDSSSEEGRRRQQVRREKRRTKKIKQETVKSEAEVVVTDTKENLPPVLSVQPIAVDIPILESDLETTETDTDEDFYDKQPQKLASQLMAEKREKILQMATTGIGPYINGSMVDSRPPTPNLPDDIVKPKKKSKSKKKKKKKSSKHDSESKHCNIPNSYNEPPISITIPKNSPSVIPIYSPIINNIGNNVNLPYNNLALNESDSNTRASKRRRVPNKFYGYSSDEEAEKNTPLPPTFKFRKVDLPTPKSPLVVPPITIKTTPIPSPTVEPISIRMSTGEMRVQPLRLPFPKRSVPKIKPIKPPQPLIAAVPEPASDSNSSSSDDETSIPKVKDQPALYCYCRCPYDEVSEMIGCDSDECAIEWFHFECVGIMVPPKGQWYCPDCRKKKQQRREMLQAAQMSS